ncbi:leukotriene C4 synthase isoform X1 [Monodelphis domestica]|uniref:leukotriene C4 synthase isoform X1 n=1 Tax=Monodelphis domestica TaxID=13616 RepID=UPI0024E1C5B8|nr:leukotriene C4 synthase isoform X1 [Monodelphis domestica]
MNAGGGEQRQLGGALLAFKNPSPKGPPSARLPPASLLQSWGDMDGLQEEVALLATVTLFGVLLQAYFSWQVITARRKFKVSPPATSGPPEFERVFRAQANCTEYFPLFLAVLWVAGIFFHQGVAAACGLLYLGARYRYFHGYAGSAQGRSVCAWPGLPLSSGLLEDPHPEEAQRLAVMGQEVKWDPTEGRDEECPPRQGSGALLTVALWRGECDADAPEV